jgi:putative endopeptidase
MKRTTRALMASAAFSLALTGAISMSAFNAPAMADVVLSGKPAIGAWGFDASGMDRSVKPGDDFFAYASGNWVKAAKIPDDRTAWGSFYTLASQVETQLHTLMDETAAKDNPAGSTAQKTADFYATYLDVAAIERAGLAPARADLDLIAGASSHSDIIRLMASPGLPVGGPIGMGFGLDEKNPDRYSVNVAQAGLGMPNRDYYLEKDAKSVETRAKYLAYVEKLLTLAEYAEPAKNAKAVIELETKIAEIQWPPEKQRDRDLTYNPMSRAELVKFAPDVDWVTALASAEIPTQEVFIVVEKDAVAQLAKLFKATPVETWRTYLTVRYLSNVSDKLPVAFDDATFDFFGKTIQGQPKQRDRWKRALASIGGVGGAMADAVGQLYVAKHFPPESKSKVLALIENLREAYRARIGKLDWMSDETKKTAVKKLDTFVLKIGFPDSWIDYAKLDVRKGDAIGNARRAAEFEWRRNAVRMNKPTDRLEWFRPPQDVNAYYNAQFNEIVFLAAILQPPFFDPNADPAINYGAIGGVIGHEMGHGYDDQGAKSDEKGVLRTWWNKQDEDRFKALTGRLIDQYNKFEALPGLFVKGDRTIGENIGDLGGLAVAHEAYKLSRKGMEAPVIDGFTGDQRFFLGWAQVWRIKMRDEALRTRVLTDPHSPAKFRVNGPVRNIDAWYAAFGVQPTDKLALPDKERVRIW